MDLPTDRKDILKFQIMLPLAKKRENPVREKRNGNINFKNPKKYDC